MSALDDIEAKAKAATKEWRRVRFTPVYQEGACDFSAARERDNSFIAAASPDVVLRLVAIAKAAEAVSAIEHERGRSDFLIDDWARLEAAWDALYAALAALPVKP